MEILGVATQGHIGMKKRLNPIQEFFDALRPRRVRGMREFAESEIVIPTGPYAGLPFTTKLMPWTGLLLDEFDRGEYRRFFISGAVQSGKTLIAFCIPTLYHLFEVVEPVIVGCPDVSMAQSIYEEKLRPVIEKTRYRDLLPDKGSGSRGGKFNYIRFKNGATLRFMGAGGSDAQRSSHTARVIVLTEIDKMDTAGQVSREADPVTQIESRSSSYGDRARIYAECTMSIREGRVHHEVVENGTDSTVRMRCNACGEYILPDRAHFVGWQDASNVVDAGRDGAYSCNACGVLWTERDRQDAIQSAVIAAAGQTVTTDGVVDGQVRDTDTFGFRWSCMSTALLTQKYIAEKEWRAARLPSEQAGEKEVMQFLWAEPYQGEAVDMTLLKVEYILDRVVSTSRGAAPVGCEFVVTAMDMGKWLAHWVALAKTPTGAHVVDYGILSVPSGQLDTEAAIGVALKEWRDIVTVGFAGMQPCQNWVDSGYMPDVVYRHCVESGDDWMPVKGLGMSQSMAGRYVVPKTQGHHARYIGDGYHIVRLERRTPRLAEGNADHWKTKVHDGLRIPVDDIGAITLFDTSKRIDHLQFAKHICAEKQVDEFVAGRGVVTKWEQVARQNHWLDCMWMARCAIDYAEARLQRAARSGGWFS